MDKQAQMKLVRERFTRTVTVFSDYALLERAAEAERLVRLLSLAGDERAVDVACGPGTLARVFSQHVKQICGLDLTPAMLARAKKAAADERIDNFQPVCGTALGMPFQDESFDLVVTSYSIHHIPDADATFREVRRVLRRGGKFGIIDMVVSENPERAAACNQIERARDASHTRALPISEFKSVLASSGYRLRAMETEEHPRSFDHWMHVAGWKRGDAPYEESRRLLEASLAGDAAGLRPKILREPSKGASGSRPDIEIVHTAVFLAAEKQ
ncbi:MAG TPA: methyltransferase domain-containing protein [Candidatus Acidoferrales bacterium]|nr:methyltransferase domain-containing protein [Candidatus Acidoferrales bacterium]